MDARPRRCYHVVLHRLTNEEIRQHTSKKTNSSKTAKSSHKNKNKTYKHSTPKRRTPRKTMPSRVKENIVEHSAHSTKYQSSKAVISKQQNLKTATQTYVNKNKTAEDSAHISKQQNSKTATQTYVNKNKTGEDSAHISKQQNSGKTTQSFVNKNKTGEDSAHISKQQNSETATHSYVNKNKTGEDSAHISKQQNSKTATQSCVNKNKTGEDSAHISKQQNSGNAISRCVIDGTSEDNILIVPKTILKRRKSDSIVETRQNSTKQDNNSCDGQSTSKRQRIKNDYFVKTVNNSAENIIVSLRKRKSDSEFETQSTLRSISNESFEILPKKRRQETSVCDNTNISITNTKVTTAPKFIKNQNQLSCNQSTTSKNKHTEKETLNGDKANVTIIDNSEILQNERVETYSEMQKNQSPFSKNLEIDNEDIAVLYDNLSTEDRNLTVQSHDINILNRNHEHSTTCQSEINNASRKNSHDEIENSRKLLNSMPVNNTNKSYFKTFTAAYENSLRKNTIFTIKNLYRMTHTSELDLSSSFRYGNQFSSHLTNKINSYIRLPIDTRECRFDTVCDLNESFLFNLIAAEDNDKLKWDNLQNIECVIYYSCKLHEKYPNHIRRISENIRTKTNFAGRVILTSDAKHLIKYPADLKKYLLNTNKHDFPHLRRSIDKDVGDTIKPSNETDVYLMLHEMIQGISKKYEKQKHWHHCKCCASPFSTYNELEPICPICNIYCTLDLHLKHFDSKGFPKIKERRSFISRKIKRICTNNPTRIPKLDKKDLEKKLSLDFNEKNVTSGKDSAKSLTTVEDVHKTPVNLETFENSSVTNPISNTCLHLMSGSPVTDRQESQQKVLVENTGEGEDANTGAELIMLDTSEGCGEHGTYMVTEEIPQIWDSLTEIEKLDMSGVIERIIQALDADIENPDITVENDAMAEQKSKDLQVVENLESEITDEKGGCEEQDDAILLKSTKTIQFENTMLPSLDAEPQGQDNDDSNIQFILLDDSNSGEISSTVEVTVADDEQNLSKNNSAPSCASLSIGTTSISEPDGSEIQIIEYTSICQSSSDTPNLPLTTSDVSKDLSQNSVVPTCISNPNSPEIEIIDAIIKPIESSSDTDNPKLHSPIIDEPEKNLSKKSPIPTLISHPDSPEIQIIEDTSIKSSSDTDNPKLHSTTIDEPEENLSKKSPRPTCISQTESPEIQIIEDTPVCLSSNDTSNPKLPSDTIDGTEKKLSENFSKPPLISQSDSSEFQIIECTSISQSMDMPNLRSTTTDVSNDLSENSSLPTDMPNLLATTTDVSDYLSENSSLPTYMPILLATTTDVSDDLSENSSLPTDISHCFALKIQVIEYNSVCQSSDAQDPKLLTTDESVLKIPVVIGSIEMPFNIEDNFVNNEEHLSENSICEYSSETSKLPSTTSDESKENLSENSPEPNHTPKSIFPKIQILECNSIFPSSSDIHNPKSPNHVATTDDSNLMIPVIQSVKSLTDTINSTNELLGNSVISDKIIFSRTLSASNVTDTSINSIEEATLEEEVQIQHADSNCTHEKNVCEFTDTKDHSESNFTSDRNSYMNDCDSENSLQLSMERESTEHDAKKDEDFLHTSPIVNVNNSPISSKEKVPLEEEVESENAENSNYTYERNVCEFSDINDHSESNFTSDRNSYMNDCDSENSLQLSMERESTEHDAKKDDFIHTSLIVNVNNSPISSKENVLLEEEVESENAENSNYTHERNVCEFGDTKDHSESNFTSDRNSYMNDCDSENSLQLLIVNVNNSPISSKENVLLEEEVESENAENSNYTHERNVCEFGDTKDHSESNFTSDRNSYMNDCHSENSLQMSMNAGESTERDIAKSNSISPEFLNSQNSNNLSLKTEKKGDDYTQTLPLVNVNESSISCTEEIPSEEEVQRNTVENSNCALERDFSDPKDHSESNFISDRDNYLNDCNSENSLQLSIDIEESTKVIPESNSLSHEFLNSEKAKKDEDGHTHTVQSASVNDSSISSSKYVSVEEEVQRQTAENSNFSVERVFCDVNDTKNHSESNFTSGKDSYMNDCNSENSLQLSIDTEESTKVIPESNSLSHEFLNSEKAKKDEDGHTHTVQSASVNDSSISSSKYVSVEEVQRQTAENSNFSVERVFCDVNDTKNHSESNFTSGKDSYMNDCNSENSLHLSRDTGELTEHDVQEANSVSHEFLNYPNSNDLPLKKRKKYYDVSESSVSSTEELSLEEKMQRKNSENSNYTPERYFCDFSDVKHHNESNLKHHTDKYKVSSSNFAYVDEDFPTVFLKYARVLEDLLPQEIISVKRSNADGSENTYLTLEMLGIASTIASLDILNDYSKVSKFIEFVSKCIYYLENQGNRDESEILKIKYFLKKLYVINDFIEKYRTYDKLVEDLLKNGGKISVWDSNRDASKQDNLVRYSNIDPKLSKKKSLLETKDDPSTKGTTSNICDTYLELLNNPEFLADVSQQISNKHKDRYVKFCAVINCKACNIYSDRDEDKLKNSNSHESGTRLHNKGLRLEKCIKKIKNMNEPISSDVSPGSSKKQLISAFQGKGMSPINKSNTLLPTSESDFHAVLTSPSNPITYDSISPVHSNHFSTVSKTVSTYSENLVGADSSQLNNTSCLLDCFEVVEALTTDKSSETCQNRLSPKSLMNQVFKGKRPYRKRSDNTIKEKRKYRKRNVKPTQEQLPVSTSSISSLGQSTDTSVVGFKSKENALANPPVPLCNQNASLYVSQEQQPASANPSIPLCNQDPILCIDQGQQYPHANPPVLLGNHGAICMDQRQSFNAFQASGNMNNCKTNPHFDYRMSSYSSPSQVSWHTPLTQSSSIQGVPHITGASSTSDALVQKNIRQTDSSSLSRCSVQTSVTTRTDINFETQYTSSMRHLANFVSESRSSNTSRGEFSNYEKNIQNTRTFTGSRAVPYPPQYMPRYPETFSQRPPLYSSSTSQPNSQSMYPGHHTYPYQYYPSMPHCSSTVTQSTPIIPSSSYMQSSYSSSQSTPIIPSPSYTQSSYSSSQSTPAIPSPSYTQSSYSSSQSTPVIPSPSYTQSSYSSFQPSPSLQRAPYPSPRMQRSSSDLRTLQYLHQMTLPYTHSTYK